MTNDLYLTFVQRQCEHLFPEQASPAGYSTMLSGQGERRSFVIEQRECTFCGFTQQRWVEEPKTTIDNIPENADILDNHGIG